MKVGIKVTQLFYDKLRGDKWSNVPLPVNDLTGSCKRPSSKYKVANLTGCDHSTKSNLLVVPSLKKARQASSLGSMKDETSNPAAALPVVATDSDAQHGPSVKATKSDDAKVNEQQWDIWSVDNFHLQDAVSAKICIPGTYCPDTHGKLFQGL